MLRHDFPVALGQTRPQDTLPLSQAETISGWKRGSPKQVSTSHHGAMPGHTRSGVWVIQDMRGLAGLPTYSKLGSLITEPQTILCTWKLLHSVYFCQAGTHPLSSECSKAHPA